MNTSHLQFHAEVTLHSERACIVTLLAIAT